MNKKEILLKLIGVFYVTFGFFAIIHAIYLGQPSWIFWLCYIGMILIGLGSLTKNSLMIKSQLNILTIPLLIWIADFFSILIFNNSFLGTTEYFFNQLNLLARIISLEHFFLVPLGFLSLYLIKKPSKRTYIISMAQLITVLIITHIITSSKENVNCVFRSCVSFIPNNDFYLIYLISLVIVMILITDLFISKIFKL